jgi:glucuronate isomerase
MSKPLALHPDRLFPADPATRAVARRLYEHIRALPIVSPHGHTDARWFADNAAFSDPVQLLVTPDHYLLRMLYSLGVPLEQLGVQPPIGAHASGDDARAIWRLFASHYHVFRATPSRLWLDSVFAEIFGMQVQLGADTADHYFDVIQEKLRQDSFRPRALFDTLCIEVLATTESPLDELAAHRALREGSWPGRVITTFRPDPVLDPQHENFRDNLRQLSQITGRDAFSYDEYLQALRDRRRQFAALGATATDHGHPSAATADLSQHEAQALFRRVSTGPASAADAEQFRAHMLTVMAGMSLEDGLVMQIHPGAWRNHNAALYARFGSDKGADIPTPTNYVQALKPLLDRYGNERDLTVIVFTLDESTYARELAPLAGHYPVLKLGPAWWFHDSPQGMRRFRRQTTETAGFYNTVGFNDDTRAFLSIPARHDVARRIDSGFLAELVTEHQLDEDEAAEVAVELTYTLVKLAYKL